MNLEYDVLKYLPIDISVQHINANLDKIVKYIPW